MRQVLKVYCALVLSLAVFVAGCSKEEKGGYSGYGASGQQFSSHHQSSGHEQYSGKVDNYDNPGQYHQSSDKFNAVYTEFEACDFSEEAAGQGQWQEDGYVEEDVDDDAEKGASGGKCGVNITINVSGSLNSLKCTMGDTYKEYITTMQNCPHNQELIRQSFIAYRDARQAYLEAMGKGCGDCSSQCGDEDSDDDDDDDDDSGTDTGDCVDNSGDDDDDEDEDDDCDTSSLQGLKKAMERARRRYERERKHRPRRWARLLKLRHAYLMRRRAYLAALSQSNGNDGDEGDESHGCHDGGYDEDGYDREGYDRQGYDRQGYDRQGYDRDGYDRKGYDRDGYDRAGYDREGYDRKGYDRDGYDREGYDGDRKRCKKK